MVTNNIQVVCPKCKAVNSYEIKSLKVYDNDLHITYSCDCGCEFTNVYALVYLGGHTDSIEYDRDNITVAR